MCLRGLLCTWEWENYTSNTTNTAYFAYTTRFCVSKRHLWWTIGGTQVKFMAYWCSSDKMDVGIHSMKFALPERQNKVWNFGLTSLWQCTQMRLKMHYYTSSIVSNRGTTEVSIHQLRNVEGFENSTQFSRKLRDMTVQTEKNQHLVWASSLLPVLCPFVTPQNCPASANEGSTTPLGQSVLRNHQHYEGLDGLGWDRTAMVSTEGTQWIRAELY